VSLCVSCALPGSSFFCTKKAAKYSERACRLSNNELPLRIHPLLIASYIRPISRTQPRPDPAAALFESGRSSVCQMESINAAAKTDRLLNPFDRSTQFGACIRRLAITIPTLPMRPCSRRGRNICAHATVLGGHEQRTAAAHLSFSANGTSPAWAKVEYIGIGVAGSSGTRILVSLAGTQKSYRFEVPSGFKR
jgi:hypothetical protein